MRRPTPAPSGAGVRPPSSPRSESEAQIEQLWPSFLSLSLNLQGPGLETLSVVLEQLLAPLHVAKDLDEEPANVSQSLQKSVQDYKTLSLSLLCLVRVPGVEGRHELGTGQGL